MALNTSKCNHLTPLRSRGLKGTRERPWCDCWRAVVTRDGGMPAPRRGSHAVLCVIGWVMSRDERTPCPKPFDRTAKRVHRPRDSTAGCWKDPVQKLYVAQRPSPACHQHDRYVYVCVCLCILCMSGLL